ncbi:hypothetical protein ACWD4L_28040 [Streptomyces sp. NPDC002596]
MKQLLSRRVAPVLLIGQIAYVALVALLFALPVPDTSEIDHTAPSVTSHVLFTALLVVTLLVMGGGAALLGWEKVRTRAPLAAQTAWLGVLGLGEIAIAAAFLNAASQESFGPDTLIAALAIAVSIGVALTCVSEVHGHLRRPKPKPLG